MNKFKETLNGVEKIMYTAAVEFYLSINTDATEESAHEAGLKELKRLGRLREEHSKPTTCVDLSTGKTFQSTI